MIELPAQTITELPKAWVTVLMPVLAQVDNNLIASNELKTVE